MSETQNSVNGGIIVSFVISETQKNVVNFINVPLLMNETPISMVNNAIAPTARGIEASSEVHVWFSTRYHVTKDWKAWSLTPEFG